ncbi:MAG: hypothetical protein JSW17_06345 [Candidatus Omnitrophota bacterium]|nr:MAG: hypothetical protein JSW17_06345 [Candidatus Omnitrophota bacterium]
MAEEQAQEKKKGAGLKKAFGILMGILLIVAGITLVVLWFADLLIVVRGCVGAFLALAGAITIAIAKE